MKKSITLLAIAFGISGAFAQEGLTSKKGEPYLPEEGDWSIGIDATPFLQYAGNMFGKTNNNIAPTFNFITNGQTITGKMFKDAQTAYRGSLRIGTASAKERNMVTDRLAMAAMSPTANGYPSALPMKENVWKQSQTMIGLAAGMEMRRGKTRLQGYYGGEAGLYVGMRKDKFTYGNALAATSTPSLNVDVDTDDEFTGMNVLGNMANNLDNPPIGGLIGDARVTERKYGAMFSFGLRGFIGAEYFILPKMSIGGEFGWGLGITSWGKTKTTWESVGNNGNPSNTQNQVGTTEIIDSKRGGWMLDTDNKNSVWGPSGTLRFNLYF